MDSAAATMLAGSAGLSFAFALGARLLGREHALAQAGGRINAYVTIAKDGTITITSPAIEMGQGGQHFTAADHRGRARRRLVEGQGASRRRSTAVYNHPILQQQLVVGSLTTRGYWIPCRTAAAQARRVLLDAAAERWNVPVAELTTEPSTRGPRGVETPDRATARWRASPGPGEDAGDQARPAQAGEEFRLIGKDVPRPTCADKSSGRPIYAMDVQVPGMVYATLARAPVRGSGPTLVQPRRAQGATRHRRCGRARQRRRHHRQHGRGGVRRATANSRPNGATRTGLERKFRCEPARVRRARARSRPQGRGRPHDRRSQCRDRRCGQGARQRIHLRLRLSRADGAACPASLRSRPTASKCGPARNGRRKAVAEAAKAAGVTPDKVTLHADADGRLVRPQHLRRIRDRRGELLSKAAGKPVKMIQSRCDDVVHGRFRPMYAQRIEVGLDAGGKVVGWRHRIAADTVVPYIYDQKRMEAQKGVDHIVFAGADVPHYDVPAHVADHIYEERGVRTAAWRGIGAGATNFAIEVMIDELAQLAGQDPARIPARAAQGSAREARGRDRGQDGRMDAASATARRSVSRSASSGCRRSASRWSGRSAEVSLDRASGQVSAATISGARPTSACRCSPATWWRSSRAR